jgi:hypothetical protein
VRGEIPIRRLLQGRGRRSLVRGVERVKFREDVAERPARAGVEVPGAPQLHTLESPEKQRNREPEAGQSPRTPAPTDAAACRSGGAVLHWLLVPSQRRPSGELVLPLRRAPETRPFRVGSCVRRTPSPKPRGRGFCVKRTHRRVVSSWLAWHALRKGRRVR